MEGTEPRPLSLAATAVLLHWSYLRSMGLVAQALSTQYPTREAWDAARTEPAFVESVESFGQLIAELRTLAATLNITTLEELGRFGAQHHDRALEAVEALAGTLKVDAADLLSVSIYA